MGESSYAQQLVLELSPAQSAVAVHNRTVKVKGAAGVPHVAPGSSSAQLVWQLEVSSAIVHVPTTPPSMTSVAQQTVSAPHSLVPVLPVQSSG
jgi:hypothetical protein